MASTDTGQSGEFVFGCSQLCAASCSSLFYLHSSHRIQLHTSGKRLFSCFDTRLSVNCSRKQSTKSLIDGCANSLTTRTNCNLPVSIYLIPSWLRGSGRQHCQVVRVPDMKSKGHRFMTLPDHQLELFRGGSVQLLSYACF